MFLENRIQKLILISKYVKTSEVAKRFWSIIKSVLVIKTSTTNNISGTDMVPRTSIVLFIPDIQRYVWKDQPTRRRLEIRLSE